MTRKEIVKRLGEHLGVTPKYLSVPSFNYQITTANEIYTIDRHGVITTSDGQVVSMEEILNAPPPSAAVAEEEIKGRRSGANGGLWGWFNLWRSIVALGV
jgi:hypothetical protein